MDKKYLIKAVVFTDTNDSKRMVLFEEYEDIFKATTRYEEIEKSHPISLSLYEEIDRML